VQGVGRVVMIAEHGDYDGEGDAIALDEGRMYGGLG
jgi:hypothetical protein